MDFPENGRELAEIRQIIVKLHKICKMAASDHTNHGENPLRGGFQGFWAVGLPAAPLRRGPKTAKWGSEPPRRPRKPVSYGVLKMKTPQDTLLTPL